ncbi:CGNR zinc finger domain-containing protein [Actinomadura litoris]|uniref:CGNR zinc finger domain-containing protein n=1 Tax=Actinomadura litoris TaxID=2678616 RepID=UPI001FA81693|nr:CGNR zinc finger domain-containing protein [Actinomadura litoris]
MADAGPGEDAALLLRDFVNTLDVDSGTDGLAAPADLARWLTERGLVPSGTAASDADLAMGIALREGLRAAMLAHRGPTDEEVCDLDDVLAELPLRVVLDGPRPALVPAGDAAAAAAGLARVASAIMDAAAAGTWARLKVCEEDTCRWAFLDTSKNRSRAWCSMKTCGNRTKTRAYRARRRPPAGAAPAR